MDHSEPWLDWAVELQSIAQAGLYYGKDRFDRERYQRVREIAAQMLSHKTGISPEKVQDLFCCETGYQTPKLDTRAAIFQGETVLLVQETDGRWSLPGGWVDAGLSVKENTIKEVREEAGLEVSADRIVAILDRNKQPGVPPSPFGICKIFVQCTPLGGSFQPNLETLDSGFFALDELPALSVEKTTEEQIRMCFDAYHTDCWNTRFE